MFEVLCRAGFEENLVVEGQRALSGFVLGYVQMELGGAIFRPPEMRTDNHPIDIRRLPEAEFPRIRAFAPYLVHYYSDDAFERGLDVIFAGLRAALDPIPEPRFRPHGRAAPAAPAVSAEGADPTQATEPHISTG
jgi:hypothetical protein